MRQWLWVLIVALLAAGCVDTEDPSWWNDAAPPIGPGEESGATLRLPGQTCSECTDCFDWQSPPADSLRIHFIDVGQGDAVYIQTPSGRNIMVDAGDLGYFGRTNGGELVSAYLTRQGLPNGSTIDAALITHAHSDHFGGMNVLLDSYVIDTFVDPGLEATTPSYKSFVSRVEGLIAPAKLFRPALLLTGPEAGINTLVDVKGDAINIFGDGVGAWVLSSESNMRLGDDDGSKINNTSLVLKLSYAGRRVLLLGDAENELEGDLVRRFGGKADEPNLASDIVKVGHHGSATSSSSVFVGSIWPGADDGNRYGIIQSGRLSFNGTQLPDINTVRDLQVQLGAEHLFSTEAGDGTKDEGDAAGDDHVLAVIRADGSMYVCYTEP